MLFGFGLSEKRNGFSVIMLFSQPSKGRCVKLVAGKKTFFLAKDAA